MLNFHGTEGVCLYFIILTAILAAKSLYELVVLLPLCDMALVFRRCLVGEIHIVVIFLEACFVINE